MSILADAPTAFTFDDFVLVPNYSAIRSRKDPRVEVDIAGIKLDIPIIAAPMNTVTEEEMLVVMGRVGGAAVLHRFMSVEKQAQMIKSAAAKLSVYGVLNPLDKIFAAIGTNGDFLQRASALRECGLRNFCIDTASGHSENCLSAVSEMKREFPDSHVMAGNVCSYAGAFDLAQAGVDSIRTGVGSGSVCTTRQVTGHGLPQLSALEDCVKIKASFPNIMIISDGGIRKSGDVVKSLAVGADTVMIGSLLAGTQESPGEIIEEGDRLYKYLAGMASEMGRAKWFDRAKSGFVPEGISTKIPYTGKIAEKVIEGIIGGLKSGMSYAGANDLKELVEKAKWARVTNAGVIEGTPHGKY